MQYLAPILNDQQVDVNGDPLSGGTVEVYVGTTSTPAPTTSDKAGAVPNAWPIVLNVLGVNAQGMVWIAGGQTYKFVIKDENGVVQRVIDGVSGVNDAGSSFDQWVLSPNAPTYISGTSFSVGGDQTGIFQVGRRVRTVNSGGVIYSTILTSVFSSGITTITLQNDAGTLDNGLSQVFYGLISPQNSSLAPVYPFGNLVINGNFAINQRAYVTATPTTGANQYTLDRWRVVVSGQSVSFGAAAPDRTVTCPAGGLEQIIEGAMIGGGVYTLSWTGTATATLNGAAIANGANLTLPANTNASLVFSSGTVGNVQLRPGPVVTQPERRPLGIELLLCQRFYAILRTTVYRSSSDGTFGGSLSNFSLPVSMRATPTLSWAVASGTSAASNASMNNNRDGQIYYSGAGPAVGTFTVFEIAATAEL